MMTESMKQTAAPADRQKKKVPEKPIYAGRITLGVSLVVMGLLMTASLFLPTMDLLQIAKFAPLILVLLGIEILTAAFRYKNQNVRVGFGLTLLCLVLIFASVGAAVLPQVWQEYGPGRWEAQQAEEQQLTRRFYEEVDSTQLRVLQLLPDDRGGVSHAEVIFQDTFATKEAFVRAALPVVRTLADMDTQNAFISAEDDWNGMFMALNGVYSLNDVTEDRLLSTVEVEYHEIGDLVPVEEETAAESIPD